MFEVSTIWKTLIVTTASRSGRKPRFYRYHRNEVQTCVVMPFPCSLDSWGSAWFQQYMRMLWWHCGLQASVTCPSGWDSVWSSITYPCRLNARTVIFKNRDIELTALSGRNRVPVRLSTLDERSDWPTETVLLRKHRYISIPIRSSTELPMSRYEYSQAHASDLPEVYCILLQDHNSGDSENQGLEILDVKGAQHIISWISHPLLNQIFVLEALLYWFHATDIILYYYL